MVSSGAIRTVVGIIGNVISLGLFLSPVPTFHRIRKRRSVEQFSPAPYLAALLNCMMWVVYGLPMVHPHSILVITINGSGTAIELSYLIMFLIYSGGTGCAKRRLRILACLVAELALVLAVAAAALTLAHTHRERSAIVGVVCVVLCTFMYAAPLSIMKMVIETKSVEFMPLALSLAAFFNGACWTAYALIRFDLYIVIPNSIGLVLATAQLVLYAVYYKSTKMQQRVEDGGARKQVEVAGMTPEVVVNVVVAGDSAGSPAGKQLSGGADVNGGGRNDGYIRGR